MRTVAALCRNLTADPRPDGELLGAFANDQSEAAFTELVRRHGPLVWGTCRRLLHDPADAEDAFQAAFLVLVRRAGQLTRYSCVGPWMHRVAVWTARNVRRKNARRFARQTALPDSEHVPDQSPDVDLKADLDAALLALPARYRDPIVLCHLLGFTRREAAERLGCPEGTLSGWLNRGLAKLRERLRGLDPSKALTAAPVAVPAALCASTARAAVATVVATASVPPAVSLLVEGVLRMFWVKKATAASVALCVVFTLGVGMGLGTRTEYSGAFAQEGVSPGKVPTGAVGGPTATDNAKLIAALERDIAEYERFREKVASAAKEITKTLPNSRPVVPPTEKQEELQSAEHLLAKLQEQLKAIDAELANAKAKLAKLKADAKPQPAKPDPKAELERFKKELTEAEKVLGAQKVAGALAARELKLADEIGAAKRADEARKELERCEAACAEATEQCNLLREKIKAIEATLAADAKPGPAEWTVSELADMFGTPAELEGAVTQVEAEVERAAVQYEVVLRKLKQLEQVKDTDKAQLEASKAVVAKAQADRELMRKALQVARARLTAARALRAPPLKALGACIEVVVVDGPAPGLCRVREYGRGGALVGSVLAEDAKALELILTRALKDPAGPRDFWLVVSADHAPDAIVRAAKAGKAAGFTQVRLKGTVPEGLEATKGLSEREFDGAAFDLAKFAP